MSSISSIASSTAGSLWDTVKSTINGAANGDMGDMAKVAIGAAVLTGSMPVSTGVAAMAGNYIAGSLLDVFV